MGSFCGDNFWDYHQAHNSSYSDFPPCLEDIFLFFAPCSFIWILSPFLIYKLHHQQSHRIPWTLLNLFKIFLGFVLAVCCLSELLQAAFKSSSAVYSIEYLLPFVKLLTFLLVIFIMTFHRHKGVHSSGVLFLFWLLLLISSLINCRSIFINIFTKNDIKWPLDRTLFIIRIVYIPVVFVQFILSCFADLTPDYFLVGSESKNVSPRLSASFLSKITFSWFDSMAYRGFKRSLLQEDVWNLEPNNKTENLINRFNIHWNKMIASDDDESKKLADYDYDQRFEEEKEKIDKQRSTEKINIAKALFYTFYSQLLVCGSLKLISCLIIFVNPMLMNLIIDFVSNSDEPVWKGYLYAFLMLTTSITDSLISSQYEFRVNVLSMNIRSPLISTIYKKSLKLSNTGKKDFTTGEIVNLMSVDTQRIMDFIQVLHLLWSAPLQIVFSIYLLWGQLGVSTLAGLIVLILLVPFNAFTSIKMRQFQSKLMRHKDKRTKLMSDILNNIKVLKLYAWETAYEKKINQMRKNEINALTPQAYIDSAIVFAFSCTPIFVAIASFTTFVLIDSNNILNAQKAFVSLALFNILRIPLAFLPLVVSYATLAFVSLRRINKYLQGDDLESDIVSHKPNNNYAVTVKNGSFSWSQDDTPVLKDINLNIQTGKLVAIVGQVGEGKSSLLSALLGDLHKISGKVNLTSSIAYVPQIAWIQNAILRQNITFTSAFDKKKYDQVIKACALEPDLKILDGGDMTEIGERGINLSGGQKQRISLARAIYCDSDIYLLDDPLSAVDSHVSKHIFDQVIGPDGILKNKTRLLVTHRLTILPQVDEIIVLKDGCISEQGTYSELIKLKGDFADILVQYFAQETELGVNEDAKAIEEFIEKIDPDLKERITKARSEASDLLSNSNTVSLKRDTSFDSRSFLQSVSSTSPQRQTSQNITKLVEVEAVETGSVKWSVYGKYFKAVGVWPCLVTILAFCFSSSFNLFSSLWLTSWSADPPSNDTSLRNTRLAVYSALGLGETLFILTSSIVFNIASLNASKIIHSLMLARVLRAPMSYFDTTPLGRILNRFSKDIDVIDISIRFNLRMLISQLFRTIVAFCVICLESPFFLILFLPISFCYLIIQKFYICSSRQLKRIESTTRSPIYSHFSETINGANSIRAYSAQDKFIDECHRRVDLNHSSYYMNITSNRWLSVRLEFLGYIIIFMTALFAVLSRGNINPGLIGLSISYSLTMTSVLNMLVRASSDAETNIVSVERCLEYTTIETEPLAIIESYRPDDNWPGSGRIEFLNYSTQYRSGTSLVLRNISFKIKPGERVGVVGRTGAGKSSLTLAIFRILEPVKGTIMIDDLDISKMGLQDLRSKLTIIPQDPGLFVGSFRDNFDPFGVYSDKDIWSALEKSNLKSFVISLGAGLDHQITESGENLSVGQKQLVCLTRALLRRNKILILDEATAAVDVETDELIQATIKNAFRDCTILTIAHRISTVMDYDKIIVMDKGKIVEYDNPQALVQDKSSLFYSLAKEAKVI